MSQIPSTSKWKSDKYKRSACEKRRREKSLLPNQHLQPPTITSFFSIIDSVKKLIDTNHNLIKIILDYNNTETFLNQDNFNTKTLLIYLYESANNNKN